MVYLITFSCYGCHLHGGEAGLTHRNNHQRKAPFVGLAPGLAHAERRAMTQEPYVLDEPRRHEVLASIRAVCAYREWQLLAAHVRTTHVHTVVCASEPPEAVMLAFKAYASRHLNARGFDSPDRKRWARHGSTRWLRWARHVSAAIQYVLEEQGAPMARFPEGAA